MVEQHGTLKFVGTGAFLVLSLPVSGFRGIDDDADSRLSSAELRSHWKQIEEQVQAAVRLRDAQGARPLEGLILNTSPPHEKPDEPADQIVVLGRFALADEAAPLTLEIELWGKTPAERTLQIGVTRDGQKKSYVLTPERPSQPI